MIEQFNNVLADPIGNLTSAGKIIKTIRKPVN